MTCVTPEQVRAGVEAYDRARCESHGQPYDDRTAMSEQNKETIAPMIRAAIEAALLAAPLKVRL